MRFSGVRRLRWAPLRAERWLRHRFAFSALILVYHRVADLPSDPQLLAVAPHHFAEHLEVLRRHARPLQLAELVEALRAGRVPQRAVVVTLDDGYADNLLNAQPLLQQYEIPATVFVTAGRVGTDEEFWWDELDRLVLQPGERPATLRLTPGGREWRWLLDGATVYDNATFERYRGWHIERSDVPTARHGLYRSLYHLLHALSPAEREPVLNELRVWAGASSVGRPSHRTLAVEELSKLNSCELIEIGSHTMSHPVLTALSAPAQRSEIQRSKERLEALLGQPVANFAYPHGSGSAQTVAIVREAGHECACATHPDVVWSGADPFRLPRVAVRNTDGDAFARLLRYWLDG